MRVELFEDLEVRLREIPRSKAKGHPGQSIESETKKSMCVGRKGGGRGEGRKETYSLDLYPLDRTPRSKRRRNAHLKQLLQQLQRPRQEINLSKSSFLLGVSFVDVGLRGVFGGERVGGERVEEVLSCGGTTGERDGRSKSTGLRRGTKKKNESRAKSQLLEAHSAPSGAKKKEEGRQASKRKS